MARRAHLGGHGRGPLHARHRLVVLGPARLRQRRYFQVPLDAARRPAQRALHRSPNGPYKEIGRRFRLRRPDQRDPAGDSRGAARALPAVQRSSQGGKKEGPEDRRVDAEEGGPRYVRSRFLHEIRLEDLLPLETQAVGHDRGHDGRVGAKPQTQAPAQRGRLRSVYRAMVLGTSRR